MEITHEDLITAGMRREIAGRMGKIVSLSPLSREDYAQILNKFVIPALSGGVREVVVDEGFAPHSRTGPWNPSWACAGCAPGWPSGWTT